MRKIDSIKPQDILLLMKSLVESDIAQKDLASALSISTAEISYGLRRLKKAKLIQPDGKPNKSNCLEFFVHALKYICPVEFGQPTLGVPTAHSFPGLKLVKNPDDQKYVWPYGYGDERGIALVPIYPTVPESCKKDKKLYEFASLVDMLRAGKARERNFAVEKLNSILVGKNG